MADHIAAMLDIRYRITQAGETIPDLHIARAMILSLPKTSSWDMIKIQLFDLDSKALTSEIVSTKLQSEALVKKPVTRLSWCRRNQSGLAERARARVPSPATNATIVGRRATEPGAALAGVKATKRREREM